MATDLAMREDMRGPHAPGATASAPQGPRLTALGRAVLPLALVFLSSLTPFVGNETDWPGRGLLAGLAALTLLCAITGHRATARLGLGLTATVAAGALLPWQVGWWPLPGLVGVGVYLLAHAVAGHEPGRHHPILGFGRLAAAEAAMVLGLVVGSAVALLFFFWSAPPRLGTGAGFLETMTPWTLVTAGLVFAAVNAFVEEVLFRGAIQHHLAGALGNWPAVLTQALAFGMLHLNGYPYGPVGITLAAVYGLLLGALRLRSGGLLAPWIAHACTDAVIFVLIVHTAT
jgi:membrane protease YdiL (CAAX protease family)